MKLNDQSVVVDAPREICFEVVAAAGRRLEERSIAEWVVEFKTSAGSREFRTIELLTLERPIAIHYRWLQGPLPEVHETIRFASLGDHKTRLAYTGRFSVGRGLLGWVIGRLRVKRRFDRLVLEHLQQAKEVAERRATRTRVHLARRKESLDESSRRDRHRHGGRR
ncbi:MAG: hypothetical protein ACRDK3_02010 [Actinomycetota bacterium]